MIVFIVMEVQRVREVYYYLQQAVDFIKAQGEYQYRFCIVEREVQ